MTKRTVFPKPTFTEEELLWSGGIRYIAGVDEVGRGAFAGPVVAAAVILPQKFSPTDEINDSKMLSAKKREQLATIIKSSALSFAIAEVGLTYINKVGIGKATQMAFRKAIRMLAIAPEFILIDAFYIQRLKRTLQKPIIHGDRLSISIAAASIIAKVHRDQLMEKLHKRHQVYSFCDNKGYGTKKHREAIEQFGLCKLHRTSFDLTKFLSQPEKQTE